MLAFVERLARPEDLLVDLAERLRLPVVLRLRLVLRLVPPDLLRLVLRLVVGIAVLAS